MRIPILGLYFAFLGGLASVGCSTQCWSHPGRSDYVRLTQVDEASNTKLVSIFGDLPIGKQIDVFLYAKHCRKDPRFEPILAKGGPKYIPEIVERIEDERWLWDKVYLVSVLTTMNRKCRCIGPDSEVVRRLEAERARIDDDNSLPRDYEYKRMYSAEIDLLKRQNVPSLTNRK